MSLHFGASFGNSYWSRLDPSRVLWGNVWNVPWGYLPEEQTRGEFIYSFSFSLGRVLLSDVKSFPLPDACGIRRAGLQHFTWAESSREVWGQEVGSVFGTAAFACSQIASEHSWSHQGCLVWKANGEHVMCGPRGVRCRYDLVLRLQHIITQLSNNDVFLKSELVVCGLVTKSRLTLCYPMNYSLPGSTVYEIFQARILEWVAISLLQGIFLTQGSNLGLLPCRQILYQLSHQD